MANELKLLPNPDNIPGLVSSGYQRQNTSMYAVRAGLDTTEPFDDGNGVITIPYGGLVEIKGCLFCIYYAQDITLNKRDYDIGNNIACWVAIHSLGGNKAQASLVTRPGKWDSGYQGFYRPDGKRTLNWVSQGQPSVELGNAIYNQDASMGDFTARLRKGWYCAQVKGGNGGAGGTGDTSSGNGTSGSAGEAKEGVFLWEGGPLNVKVGQNGGRGGDRFSVGGINKTQTGGGGGGGGLSAVGSIVASGGRPGKGGRTLPDTGAFNGEDGKPANGIYGGAGGDGGDAFVSGTLVRGGNGGDPGGCGYARIWLIE